MKFNKCMRCGCFFTTSDDVCPNCKEKDQVDISSLKSYLANNETPATISSLSFNSGVSEKNIFFNFAAYKFSSVLIDGQFPNYDRVIPESQQHFFEANREDFLQALKRVALLVEQKSKRIFLKITDGSLAISSNENELGTADEEIACQYQGEETNIALNYAYLEEPLKVLNSDKLKIEFTDPMRAITLRPEADTNFFHIIMPMQME